ncbi:MAG: hypothetical protein ABUT20_09270 [Bacteroidota bacterium]
MKHKLFSLYVFAIFGLAASCQKAPGNLNNSCATEPENIAIAARLLTLPDAEKIMGEPAKLSCNTFIKKGDTLEYKCDYTALQRDAKTGKTGKLYFMYEIYNGTSSAASSYKAIYEANRIHEGVEVVKDLGSEAYYHTDGTGFYFYLVRKNEKMFRLKLNKITSHSSALQFKTVTKQIADKL